MQQTHAADQDEPLEFSRLFRGWASWMLFARPRAQSSETVRTSEEPDFWGQVCEQLLLGQMGALFRGRAECIAGLSQQVSGSLTGASFALRDMLSWGGGAEERRSGGADGRPLPHPRTAPPSIIPLEKHNETISHKQHQSSGIRPPPSPTRAAARVDSSTYALVFAPAGSKHGTSESERPVFSARFRTSSGEDAARATSTESGG